MDKSASFSHGVPAKGKRGHFEQKSKTAKRFEYNHGGRVRQSRERVAVGSQYDGVQSKIKDQVAYFRSLAKDKDNKRLFNKDPEVYAPPHPDEQDFGYNANHTANLKEASLRVRSPMRQSIEPEETQQESQDVDIRGSNAVSSYYPQPANANRRFENLPDRSDFSPDGPVDMTDAFMERESPDQQANLPRNSQQASNPQLRPSQLLEKSRITNQTNYGGNNQSYDQVVMYKDDPALEGSQYRVGAHPKYQVRGSAKQSDQSREEFNTSRFSGIPKTNMTRHHMPDQSHSAIIDERHQYSDKQNVTNPFTQTTHQRQTDSQNRSHYMMSNHPNYRQSDKQADTSYTYTLQQPIHGQSEPTTAAFGQQAMPRHIYHETSSDYDDEEGEDDDSDTSAVDEDYGEEDEDSESEFTDYNPDHHDNSNRLYQLQQHQQYVQQQPHLYANEASQYAYGDRAPQNEYMNYGPGNNHGDIVSPQFMQQATAQENNYGYQRPSNYRPGPSIESQGYQQRTSPGKNQSDQHGIDSREMEDPPKSTLSPNNPRSSSGMAADDLEPSPQVNSRYLNADAGTDSRPATSQAYMNPDEMRTSSAQRQGRPGDQSSIIRNNDESAFNNNLHIFPAGTTQPQMQSQNVPQVTNFTKESLDANRDRSSAVTIGQEVEAGIQEEFIP